MQASKLAVRLEDIYEQAEASKGDSEPRDLLILGLLLLVHVSCFLPACFKVGFYLDDWLTFWNLHFAPHNFIDLLKASFCDPRMVTRPVQCFYYASTYFFFGDRPLPYHLLRFGLEFLSAFFLYSGMKRLSSSGFVAAMSALFFILYPTHDATHYWIGAGLGPGFGLTLFLASFCFSMHAFWSNRKDLYAFAVACYGLSAFCYESFLPLLVMNFCGVLLLSAEKRTHSRLKTMGSVISWFLPFLAVGFAEPVYQRIILPRLTHVFLSPSALDPSYAFNVFVQGLNMSMFAGLWSFLAQRVRESLISFTPLAALQLFGVLASSLAIILVSFSKDQPVRYRRLFTAATLTFFASYLTFAVAQGYMPVLDTMINRVNIGASVAVSILLALSIKWLVERTRLSKKAALAVCAICLPMISVIVLANLALASFWACSWEVQKNVRFLVQQHASEIKDGDSIILADTHRYLMWAPVFDGTWDFQSMLRMTLNKKDSVSAGVISDRLSIKGNELQDVSANFLCGTYPFEKLTVLFPSEKAWLKAHSSSEFISLIEKKSKRHIDTLTLKRWHKESEAP